MYKIVFESGHSMQEHGANEAEVQRVMDQFYVRIHGPVQAIILMERSPF
jgi:hypothetical protein